MARFAEGTSVPIEKSRAEIERLVSKYGAEEFISARMSDRSVIAFVCQGRRVQFELVTPNVNTIVARYRKGHKYRNVEAGDPVIMQALEHEGCRLWRALALAIKAKLEVVQSGISTFEEEFLAHVVVKNNLTVYQALKQNTNGLRLLPPVPGMERR